MTYRNHNNFEVPNDATVGVRSTDVMARDYDLWLSYMDKYQSLKTDNGALFIMPIKHAIDADFTSVVLDGPTVLNSIIYPRTNKHN